MALFARTYSRCTFNIIIKLPVYAYTGTIKCMKIRFNQDKFTRGWVGNVPIIDIPILKNLDPFIQVKLGLKVVLVSLTNKYVNET